MSIKFFDMFAGIGGFRSGLEQCGGYECIGFCEIDKRTADAYRAMYNTDGEVFYSDAREINTDELADFDLLVAGFPCQPFSTAGKRLGFSDTRGTLFAEVARVIEAKRPSFFLLENVPGLLSHNEGETFAVILDTFSELGYSFEWVVHNSADFGVPQQRKRVYIIGYLGNECAGGIFPLPLGDGETRRERISEKEEMSFIDLNPQPQLTDTARCLVARYTAGVTNHKGANSGIFIESDRACAVLTPEKENPRQNGRQIKEPDEPMFTLTVQDRHGVLRNGHVRKLTPLECWRLQGFTDEQYSRAKSAGICKGMLYKMAGNAVSVPVIAAIGIAIRGMFKERNMISV